MRNTIDVVYCNLMRNVERKLVLGFELRADWCIFVLVMSEDRIKISARTAFTEYLCNKKLRKTPERYAILDKVFDMTDHFYIESLYAGLEADSYHVSRATVYNTIELLIDCGLVRRHQFNNQPAQYEKVSGIGNHHHLICTQCGKVKEVKDPELMKVMNARRYTTFHTAYFAIYVYGVCSRCQRRGRKK